MDESTQGEAPANPGEAQATNGTGGHGEVDIDGLLAEFDHAEGNGPATPDQGPQDSPQADGGPILDDGTQARLDSLEGFAASIQERDARQAAASAFERMVKAGEADLADHIGTLPSGYVARYLNSEMAINPALADAWDAVYSPTGIPTQHDVNRLHSELTRVGKALLAEVEATAARQFDRETTADRFAVSAAVKGASTRAPDTEGPSLKEIAGWSEEKRDQYAKEVSRQYARH